MRDVRGSYVSHLMVGLVAVACGGRLAPDDSVVAPSVDGGPEAAFAEGGGDGGSNTTDASDEPDGLDASDAPAGPLPTCLTSPPPAPQVVGAGGPVLASPHVIPIFFRKDPLEASIETFLASLSGSEYWKDTTAEYGVGGLSIGQSIVLDQDSPKSGFDSDAAAALVDANLTAPNTGWPPNASGNIYVLVLQSDLHDGACGYHDETPIGGGQAVFAVVERCIPQYAWSPLDMTTIDLSHELVEASTDPYWSTAPAYSHVDGAHEAYDLALGGSEIGDMCWNGEATQVQPVDGFLVQRMWSNAQAAGGHDPCVPAPPGPFLTAVVDPNDLDAVTVVDPSGVGVQTRGVKLGPGQTRSVTLHLWADAPTSPWNLEAVGEQAVFAHVTEFQSTCSKEVKLELSRLHDAPWSIVQIDSYHALPYLNYVLVTE